MYKLKHRFEDFVVCEVLDIHPAPDENAFGYYLLRKRGISTFDAITAIAADLALDQSLLGYAGLKDEDGITEQYLSSPVILDQGYLDAGGLDDRGFSLQFLGYGAAGIRIAQNAGNRFCLTVRDLSESELDAIQSAADRTVFFLNYYDDQRFGLPDKPKNTHYIGESYMSGQLQRCVDLAIASGVMGAGADIASLDAVPQRQRAFWMSAHGSAQWNRTVSRWIDQHCEAAGIMPSASGPLWVVGSDVLMDVASDAYPMPIKKYRVEDGVIEELDASRPLIERFVLKVLATGPCPYFPGSRCATIEFTLPTGTYATMALKGLLMRSVIVSAAVNVRDAHETMCAGPA